MGPFVSYEENEVVLIWYQNISGKIAHEFVFQIILFHPKISLLRYRVGNFESLKNPVAQWLNTSHYHKVVGSNPGN
jgi:hypothetical protein